MPKNAGRKPGCTKKPNKKKKHVQDENHVPTSFSQVYKNSDSGNTGSSLSTYTTHSDILIPDIDAANTTNCVHEPTRASTNTNTSFLPTVNIP